METTNNPLTKYEIACITMGIPATNDEVLNQLIRLGARFKICADMIARDPNFSPRFAMQKADDLIEAFGQKNDKHN